MARPRSFNEDVVLERAMEAFWTHGYHSTSPAQLAEATGIAKGSLYNAFDNKRALFEKCLDVYQAQLRGLAEELMQHPGTTREVLREALRSIVDNDLQQVQRRGCLVGNTAVELAGRDPEMAAKLQHLQAESTGWFQARIERGQRDGDIGSDRNARDLALHLANTLAGLRVMAMTHEAPALHGIIDTALSLL